MVAVGGVAVDQHVHDSSRLQMLLTCPVFALVSNM